MKSVELESEFGESMINRTGIMTNPEASAELIEGAKKSIPSSKGDGSEIAASLAAYADGATIGSEPEATDGATSQGEDSDGQLESLSGFLDKLGERLAFERQGTRLYETFIRKCELLTIEDNGGPGLDDLRHICKEEKEHFEMLQTVISSLGGDATTQTPAADVAGVISHGVLQIVSDSRTNLAQMLEAILVAELADNDGWKMLADRASALGRSDLQQKFVEALQEEQEHLQNVRHWLSAMMLDEVGGPGDVLEDVEKNSPRRARKTRKSSRPRKKARKK